MSPTSRQRLRNRSRAPIPPGPALGAVLAAVLLWVAIGTPIAASAVPVALTPGAGTAGATPATRAVTSTVAAAATSALPLAAQTGGPAAVQTGGPAVIQTGGPAAVQTGGAGPVANGAAPGALGTADSGSGGAPWLPWLVGAVILAGLAGLAAFALRQRSNPPVVPVPVATAAPLEMLAEPPAAVVTQVRCPNCDALNSADRRFCDECGQDLRPATAAASAAPIPAVDEATTPYLETLSRVDEQLEFVLARNTVKIGRALDNDIVVDDQFVGWQTVSPHHARLTRQPEGFMVEDLNTDNGTFVNSARTGQNLLEDGMTIALGKVEFIYHVPQA